MNAPFQRNVGISKDSIFNSTETPLSSGATFTGTAEKVDADQVGVMVKTDNDSTLYFDFSGDGTNWDSTFPVNGFAVSSGVSAFHTAVKLGRYFRVRLVNGSGAQSYLRLYTYFGSNFIPANAPLNQSASLYQDAIFTRGTVAQDEIRIGRRGGAEGWTKFGYRSGLTAAGGEQQIWATTGNFTPLTSAETFNITYDGTGGGSTDGAGTNGALTLVFYYLDSNGNPAIATHTLGTDGTDTTSFSGLGINRVAVASSGSTNTNGSNITITATTAGTTQAFIPAGQSVTQQAIYHVGHNHDAVAKFLFINASRDAGGTPPVIVFKAYVFNRNVETFYEVFRYSMDTAVKNELTLTEPVGFNLSPSDVLYFVGETNRNSTDVSSLRFSLNQYQRT